MKTSIRLALFLFLTICSAFLFAFPDQISIPSMPSTSSDTGYCPECHHHGFPDDHDDHDDHHDNPFEHHHHDYPYDHHHDYPYDHHHDLPYGSYKKTCSHCYVDGSVLSCVCDDRNQFPRNTSLNLYHCYRHNLDVINDDGQLICGREVRDQDGINAINLFLNIK